MSEHTPLTEAEIAALLLAHQPRVEKSGRIHMCSCGEWVADVGAPPAHRWHVARILAAARTSTATADAARKATSASSLQHMPDPYAATADTGLRERVEALAEEYEADAASEGYGGELWSTTAHRIRFTLDATAAPTTEETCRRGDSCAWILCKVHAPTTDTGARDE